MEQKKDFNRSFLLGFLFLCLLQFKLDAQTNYKAEWKQVDSLINKGLTQSALQTVETIYTKAKRGNGAPQIAKAIIHKIKLTSYKEENALQKAIEETKEEAKQAGFPLKPLLHSMLAELYWSYYQNNRWKFHNRTQVLNFKQDDLSTWDLKSIVAQTIKQYNLSLQDADLLKKTGLNIYDDIITKDVDSDSKNVYTSRNLRPTLYDFLAHRAVDFYMNEEPDLIHAANRFELKSERFFEDYVAFSQMDIASLAQPNDSLNLKYFAIQLLQDLIRFHSILPEEKNNQVAIEALIDVDLKRLQFVKNKSVSEIKDSLYLRALKNLEQRFITHYASTEVSYEIADEYKIRGENYDPINSDKNKWDKKTALTICEEAMNRFPGSFGAEKCKSLQSIIKNKSLSFNVEEINLPNKPFRARVEYCNLNKVYLKIIENKRGNWNEENLDSEQLVDKFLKEKIIKEWSLYLPSDGDYQSHSTEIKIPELPLGSYILLIGSDEKFSYQKNAVAYASCIISELSFIKRRTIEGGYDVVVFHRENGQPLKGVQAQLWSTRYDYNARKYEQIKGDLYVTDENGFFTIAPKNNDSYNSFTIELSYKNDKLFTDNSIYLYKPYSYEKKKQIRTFFFKDRAIYRPGQTLFFKGIMIESDGQTNNVLTKQATTIELIDVNGQKVTSLNLISNEYGSFNGSFTLPQNGLNGEMHLRDEHGSTNFSVEEYKRPKFEVTVPPVKGVYKLNENIDIKGKAQSYAGANISNAEVKYRIVRNTSYPCYYWSWRHPSSPQIEVANGITTTNDTGGFVIRFNAIPDLGVSKKYFPSFTYSIYTDVTDVTGETHSNQTDISVGYNALLIDIEMPESILKDSVQAYNVNTTNLNGEFEPAKVKIQVWTQVEPNHLFRNRLWQQADKHLLTKEEYYAAFPNDIYEDENNQQKWEKGSLLFTAEVETKADKKELELTKLKQWENGAYVLEATTKDKFGEEIKFVKYFTVFSPFAKNTPINKYDWYTALKTNAEPGEKAAILIGTREKDVNILYEIEHDNKIIKKEWLKLTNEQKKIEIPIEEKHRGGLAVHFVFARNNRVYNYNSSITVPFSNKELNIEFETFRSKLLPGQKEEWKIKIKDKKRDKTVAEMLASMYDASLDAFVPHQWYFNIYPTYYSTINWETNQFVNDKSSFFVSKNWNTFYPNPYKIYEKLNWFDYGMGGGYRYEYMYSAAPNAAPQNALMKEESIQTNNDMADTDEKKEKSKNEPETKTEKKPSPAIIPRKNLSETAFFFPQLQTDENGSLVIKFTAPEALTRWNFMGLAHTKDLKYAQIKKEIVTQKELMVTPHAPRFFREGDKITFTSKIDNLSPAAMNGSAKLFLYDAVSMKDITAQFLTDNKKASQPFSASSKQAANIRWDLIIPEGMAAVSCKVIASAGNFSDGEEFIIPILTNRMLVTESLPISVRSKQTKMLKFEKLISQNNNSTTLRNHKLTLEFCANPAWYAVQALPYIMEYPYECAEQIFSRFYANSIASHIANSSQKIKAVFDSWKQSTSEAFYSNLEKNQELKSLLLNETPWVLDAQDESERKKRVGLLFDFNKMSNELSTALSKLVKMQSSNGGWPWFAGMPEDRYITQHIVTGMGHLDHLGIKNIREDAMTWDMIKNALLYLDNRIGEDYERLLKTDKKNIDKDHLGQLQIQYLYARSYFKDIPIDKKNQPAFNYYKGQAQKYWLAKGRYMSGMIALSLNRFDDKKTPATIIKSLKENALYSEEMGMYWKESYEGFYWYEAPIECHALLIEAFDEVANDKKSVDELRIWLLKSKQTQNWKSTKATTEAVYALLLKGTEWLSTESNTEITLGYVKIDPQSNPDTKVEAGTGYFKQSWSGNDIKPTMGNITVNKKDEGISWGALYWQYFEQLDKITPHATPLQLTKKLFIEKNSSSGPLLETINDNYILMPGDKIKVRIELRVDRSMEYVHMKDMRASGFEPVNVLSQYKWQDGLGYYESTGDAATNFFFSYLPKGAYVFEYPLVVSHTGDFSNGISSIQCMYAPEFTSHSEGIRVKVGK